MEGRLVTILYYSANVEEESFEQKIMNNIFRNSNGLPIVSVTHKPVDFGKNICVGIQPYNSINRYRQIQIGLHETRTPYVLTAEADFLYPPEYFRFAPPEDVKSHFRYNNVWVLYETRLDYRYGFFFKGHSDGAQCVCREPWLLMIDKAFDGQKEWFDNSDKITGIWSPHTIERNTWGGNPAITFKTTKNLTKRTRVKTNPQVEELPYWGTVGKIRKEYYGQIGVRPDTYSGKD